MVLAHYVADDAGALARGFVGLKAHLLHGVENAAVDGLESVADVGESASDDDRHRVIEIRLAHLVFNVDGLDVESAGTAVAGGRRSQGEFGILVVGHSQVLGVRSWVLGLSRYWAKRLHLQVVNGFWSKNIVTRCGVVETAFEARFLLVAIQEPYSKSF